jgi:hypothetical protein
MKKIMLSVQPQWLAKILNGEKTVEIRKTVPKLPCTVWLYCTKGGAVLLQDWGNAMIQNGIPQLNGQIVAKFVLEKADKIQYGFIHDVVGAEVQDSGKNGYFITNGQIESARIGYYELLKYGKTKPLFAWHIDSLVIFDKPMELKQFGTWDAKRWHENGTHWFPLNRAPQSWQYVEVIE